MNLAQVRIKLRSHVGNTFFSIFATMTFSFTSWFLNINIEFSSIINYVHSFQYFIFNMEINVRSLGKHRAILLNYKMSHLSNGHPSWTQSKKNELVNSQIRVVLDNKLQNETCPENDWYHNDHTFGRGYNFRFPA